MNKCSYGTSSPAGLVLLQILALHHLTLIVFLFFSKIGPVCWLRDDSYSRGAGVGRRSCPSTHPDHDKAAGLCYESCPPDYSGVRIIFSREECAGVFPFSVHAILIPWVLQGIMTVQSRNAYFLVRHNWSLQESFTLNRAHHLHKVFFLLLNI